MTLDSFLSFVTGNAVEMLASGAQFVVQIEVHEQPLVVRRLAVLEVDLPRDGLMPGSHRCHALRHLDRIEPHAGRVAQSVGGAQPAHDRAVFVEYLSVGTCQAEHLDLPCARNGIAVPDGHRRRVLEALGQVAAGHLAEARERDHLALDDAVTLDEVAAQVTLDHHVLQRHAFGSECEFDTLRTACHTQRVVHISQIRGDQIVVTFYPVEQERPWASVLAPIVVPSQ